MLDYFEQSNSHYPAGWDVWVWGFINIVSSGNNNLPVDLTAGISEL